MKTETQSLNNALAAETWSTIHPISNADEAFVAALRKMVEPMKGLLQGTAAREPYDGIIGHVAAPEGVTFEPDTIGGVPGWWCKPANSREGEAILHLHGGWFMLGTAEAYRNLVGHIAGRAGVAAFVANYRLAPEHPFPAAIEDAQAVYRGLAARGFRRIAISGDSAGGNLGLVLASLLAANAESLRLAGVVAISPVTDLALEGASWETKAQADPFFTKEQALGMVEAYLGDHDRKDPLASPLYGDFAGLPPIRVHVGEAEMLLDDSRDYTERAFAAGIDARIDIWQGVPHVFQSNVGQLEAADQSLNAIGAFLAELLAAVNIQTTLGGAN